MRRFNISVNGKTYEVDVEEIKDGVPVSAPVASAPVASAPKAAPVSAPKAAPAAAPAGATTVSAPMPGNILDIKVGMGASVKKGDVLCILEAMKMENEIVSPADGSVVAISTSKGASVNTGDALISIG